LLGPNTGPDGLAQWAARAKRTRLEPFAGALVAIHHVATAAGASTADLLEAVIEAVTDAQETDDARAAAVAGPRSSARLLQFLPALGLALGAAMGARPLAVLFGGGLGTVALAAGVGLVGLGRLWSGALIRAAGRAGGAEPLAAAVLAAALRAGLPVPAALAQVGAAWPGATGIALRHVGEALARGQSWDMAWEAAAADVSNREFIESLRGALWLVWNSGVEAAPLLDSLRARLGRAERRRLTEAAARLGVHLMAPLGLCYLPAFVALGLAPVLLSLADGIVPLL
jgi:tight adherence protein B